MLLQYADGQLSVVYYGCINKAASAARSYEGVGKYELDISKARVLSAQQGAPADGLLAALVARG
jgi:hypothetical protein